MIGYINILDHKLRGENPLPLYQYCIISRRPAALKLYHCLSCYRTVSNIAPGIMFSRFRRNGAKACMNEVCKTKSIFYVKHGTSMDLESEDREHAAFTADLDDDHGIYVDPCEFHDSDTDYDPSWGSSEFDVYSDEESCHEPPAADDVSTKSNEQTPSKASATKQGQKVLNKLRDWQRRKSENNVESEATTYIEVSMSEVKHPPPELPPPPYHLNDNQILRRQIINCILDSENSYVRTLQRVVTEFEVPLLEASPPIISTAKIRTIFFKVREILQCHFLFRIALASVVQRWDAEELIGDSFTASFSKSMVADAYSDFVNNFSLAANMVKYCARNKPVFAEFIMSRQDAWPDKLSLFALMVKPVQRFPQFILLLQDLLKHTPTEHSDRFNLQLALTELENLAHKLNDSKRLATQTLGATQLFKNMNVRLVRRRNETEAPLLIRQDDVAETHCAGVERTPKWKSLRLIMLNDTLMCTHVLLKDGMFGPLEKHRLKWSVPLSAVEIKDTVITPDTNVVVKGTPGHVIISSSRPFRGDQESAALYAELDSLIHDFAVITQISSMVSSLKRSYEILSDDKLQELSRTIQIRIQKLDEHLRTIDSSSLQLFIGAKRHVVVDFPSAELKRLWLDDLKTQRLAAQPSNNPAWMENEKARALFWHYPNYLAQVNLNITNEMNEVVCGVPFFVASNWDTAPPRQYVWLCGYGRHSTTVTTLPLSKTSPSSVGAVKTSTTTMATSAAIVALDCDSPHVMESFVVCTDYVTCVARVAGGGATSGKFSQADTIWMGTNTGMIHVHSVREGLRQRPVCVLTVTAPVHCLLSVDEAVFVGLANGQLLVYSRLERQSWTNASRQQQLSLGDQAVKALCADEQQIWGACGPNITVIDVFTLDILRTFRVTIQDSVTVGYIARSGVGLFVGCEQRSYLQLYHAESFKHLQDINIASTVKISNQLSIDHFEAAHITSLAVIESWLWIGTSVGSLLILPLPRLEGVPLINARPLVARHSHRSAVRFILSSATVDRTRRARASIAPRRANSKHESGTKATSSVPSAASARNVSTTKSDKYKKSRSLSDLDTVGLDDKENDVIRSMYASLYVNDDYDSSFVNSDSALQVSSSDDSRWSRKMSRGRYGSERTRPDTQHEVDDELETRSIKARPTNGPYSVVAGGEGYLDRKFSAPVRQDREPNIQVWHCNNRN